MHQPIKGNPTIITFIINKERMKKYTTFLFDFDYTLADSSRGIIHCYQAVLHNHGFHNVDDQRIKRTIGKTLEESFTLLTGITSADTLAALRKEYVGHADKHMTAMTRLFPETLGVLTALKREGARIGIISTKYRYRILELLEQVLSEPLIDIIVGGEDVLTHKPSPEGLLMAIDRLGVQPHEVLYIGDSTADAAAAQAGKVDFMGVLHGETTFDELDAYPNIGIHPDLNALLSINDTEKSTIF